MKMVKMIASEITSNCFSISYFQTVLKNPLLVSLYQLYHNSQLLEIVNMRKENRKETKMVKGERENLTGNFWIQTINLTRSHRKYLKLTACLRIDFNSIYTNFICITKPKIIHLLYRNKRSLLFPENHIFKSSNHNYIA